MKTEITFVQPNEEVLFEAYNSEYSFYKTLIFIFFRKSAWLFTPICLSSFFPLFFCNLSNAEQTAFFLITFAAALAIAYKPIHNERTEWLQKKRVISYRYALAINKDIFKELDIEDLVEKSYPTTPHFLHTLYNNKVASVLFALVALLTANIMEKSELEHLYIYLILTVAIGTLYMFFYSYFLMFSAAAKKQYRYWLLSCAEYHNKPDGE